MKTLKYFLLVITLLVFQVYGHSQERALKLTLNYAVGIPVGNLKNLSNEVSPRGWDASILYNITDQLSLGAQTGLQDFYQRFPRQVIHQDGSDLSAVITNSVQVTPLLLKGKYRFENVKIVEPYAALGAGANFINYRKYYGEFSESRTAVKFAAQPELGIYVPFTSTRRVGLNLSAGYNFMPFKYNDADGLHHVVVKGGLSFALR